MKRSPYQWSPKSKENILLLLKNIYITVHWVYYYYRSLGSPGVPWDKDSKFKTSVIRRLKKNFLNLIQESFPWFVCNYLLDYCMSSLRRKDFWKVKMAITIMQTKLFPYVVMVVFWPSHGCPWYIDLFVCGWIIMIVR